MNKGLYVLILLLFSSLEIKAQTNCDCYERLENLSDYYSSIGDYEKSLEVFEQALQYKEELDWHNWDYRQLGVKNIQAGNYDRGEKALAKALSMGYDLDYLKGNAVLEKFRESEYWKRILNNMDNYRKKYQSNLNLEYRLRIEYLSGVDQSIRRNLGKILSDSIVMEIDSMNWLAVKKMVAEYGYPSQKQDGFMGWKLSVFFLHASMYSEEMNKEIIEILTGAQEECLCRKRAIAQLIDRRLDWKEGKPQLYGLWNKWEDKGKYSEIWEMGALDSRRFEYNLLNLEAQSKIDKRALPVNYKASEYPEDYFCGWK